MGQVQLETEEICTANVDDASYDGTGPKVQSIGGVYHPYTSKQWFQGKVTIIETDRDPTAIKTFLENSHGKGRVLIIKDVGAGKEGSGAVLGEGIAKKAAERGWEGVIVTDQIRDTHQLKSIYNLAVFAGANTARSVNPHRGENKGGTVKVLKKRGVTLGDEMKHIVVRPGMYIAGDLDGFIVSEEPLPKMFEERKAALAERVAFEVQPP